MEKAFLKAIDNDPNDDAPRLIFADWLQEQNRYFEAEECITPAPPEVTFNGGNGDGYGYGDGYGDGYGYGDGDGDGYGYGDGDGDGYGDGNGYGEPFQGDIMPIVGINMLIPLPHGWVICGFVAERIGAYQFRIENAYVICRTNGVPWDELAEGKGRDKPTYRKWGTVYVGPTFIMSREWKGELPKI